MRVGVGGTKTRQSLVASSVSLTGVGGRKQCGLVDVRVWRLKLARPGPSPVAATPTAGPTCCSARDHSVLLALVWMLGRGSEGLIRE